MATTKNKVKYGLKNVHYSVISIDDTGKVTYATPVAIPGAVNISLAAQGDSTPFYADDVPYFQTTANDGYSGDLEVALVPEQFKIDVFGFKKDTTTGILYEDANVQPKSFALMFEFTGDASQSRRVFYNCTATRPSDEGATKGKSVEVKTEKMTITAIPASDTGYTKGSVLTGDTAYANWYTAVQLPGAGA